MKPEPRTATPIAKAIKRDRPSSPDIEEYKPKRQPEPEEIKAPEQSVAAIDTNEAAGNGDDYNDDMDFSILEDDENQFGQDETAQVQAAKAEKVVEVEKQKAKTETKSFESILSNWENICNDDDDDDLLSAVDVEETVLQTSNSSDMKFWFWDAWEEPIKFPGKVFLFGKEPLEKNPKEFRSVCVTIENVQRCLYALPREFVSDVQFSIITGN